MDFINCGSGYYVKEKINKYTIFVLFQKSILKNTKDQNGMQFYGFIEKEKKLIA